MRRFLRRAVRARRESRSSWARDYTDPFAFHFSLPKAGGRGLISGRGRHCCRSGLRCGRPKGRSFENWGVETRFASDPLSRDTSGPPRLLNAGYEANAIRETVLKATGPHHVFLAQGFDASVDTVLSPAMQQFRICHLATHGVYDETMPEFSGLVFSLVRPDGGPRFGFLKAYDIVRLNVRPELVVLSACDSAAGENLSGEGVMGLSYSFLRAGAREVVSTLWSIDDAKSSDLMIAFYKELMWNGGNATAALHQSQLAVMRQRQSSAPYYWAGFELTSVGK